MRKHAARMTRLRLPVTGQAEASPVFCPNYRSTTVESHLSPWPADLSLAERRDQMKAALSQLPRAAELLPSAQPFSSNEPYVV